MKVLVVALALSLVTAGSVLAELNASSTKPKNQQVDSQFKALAPIQGLVALTDSELTKIEGQVALANFHALPPNNPGTSTAAQSIPSEVFLVSPNVRSQWFGGAAGK